MGQQLSPFPFLFLLAAAMLGASPVALAAAQRTFVASYGSPANTSFNCSIAKPCRAFTEALGVTNSGGEVVVLDSAAYGATTITQSVSLVAPAGIYAGITVFSGNGVTIDAPGATVVLRGLSINGQGGSVGIYVQNAARVRIENCVVSNLASTGIANAADSSELSLLDTLVRDNGGTGIVIIAANASAVLDRVRSEHNLGDGFHVAPTVGSFGARGTVVDSLFTGNAGMGIRAATVGGATTTVVVERSVLSYNGQDGFGAAAAAGSSIATLSRNAVNDNGGHGLWMQGNVRGVAAENAVHRNGGVGIYFDAGNGNVWLHANRVLASGSGLDVQCNDAAGHLISIGSNVSAANVYEGGCYTLDGGI